MMLFQVMLAIVFGLLLGFFLGFAVEAGLFAIVKDDKSSIFLVWVFEPLQPGLLSFFGKYWVIH